MELFRIALAKYSDSLLASGRAARWNSKGKQVIYCAENRSLACLENLVHRSGIALLQDFRTLTIAIPNDVAIEELDQTKLPENWRSSLDFNYSQRIGDTWLARQQALLLKVPSVIIPEEFNYVINMQHADFKHVSILKNEPFLFDPRVALQR